jgi:general secretion pathway protein D
VPYVTGTYYGGGYSGGNSSQYSQLSVGVELDVTPFINPDGLVVMDINQEIDDIQGYTSIDGNQVPNTDKRTLSSEIAVRSLDTIMMGGFIRTDKTKTSSGVPILQDIPILGALFSNHANSKTREELLVLMRPTVMTTPQEAADQTLREERRLPGISAAAADDTADERALVAAERKAELERAKAKGHSDGFYSDTNTLLETDRLGVSTTTNTPPPVYQFNPVIQSQPASPAQPVAPNPPPVVPAQPVTPNQ